MKRLFFLIIILGTFTLHGIEVTGKGVADNLDTSRRYALSDLASFIEVHIESELNDIVREATGNNSTQSEELSSLVINTRASLPILGATYNTARRSNLFYTDAILNSSASLRLYEEQLRQLSSEITEAYSIISNTRDNGAKYALLNSLLPQISNFNKYRLVASYLGSQSIPTINISETRVKSEILQLASDISDLNTASRILTDSITQRMVFVEPPKYQNYTEVTDFAIAMKNFIIANVRNATEDRNRADYFFSGTYTISGNFMEMIYKLTDKEGAIILSRVIRISQNAYSNYTYTPRSLEFERQLRDGLVLNRDFVVELTTNKGSENLLFKTGELVKLYIKANRAGSFYIASHIFQDNTDKYSYILDLNPQSSGNNRFIIKIEENQIGSWIDIGEFSVEPPFGYETLQIVGAPTNMALLSMIPPTVYDTQTGFFKISNNPSEGLSATRGLRLNQSQQSINQTTEATLSIRTSRN